jgi:hypothetical protein
MDSHRFKHIFFWLSGAGTETLERCPDWEQRKYVAFGATVLVPTVFALIASAYAVSTLTSSWFVMFLVACVWAFIILSIDRALLASYRPFQPLHRKAGQFLMRFVVALLMGVTIAHPLVLLLFRDTITTRIEADREREIAATRQVFEAEKAKVEARRGEMEAKIATQREEWNKTYKAQFIVQKSASKDSLIPGLTDKQSAALKKAVEAAKTPFAPRLREIEAQLSPLLVAAAKNQQELAYWQVEFERELDGQRSGRAGEGPRARSIRADQLEPRRQEAARMSVLIQHLTSEKASLEAATAGAEKSAVADFERQLQEIDSYNKAEAERAETLRRQVEEDQASSFLEQQSSIRETIKGQIDSNLAVLDALQKELARVSAEEATRLESLRTQPRRDILVQTLALHELFETGKESGKFAFWTYVILTCLFMLVDTIPLLVKFFTKSGPYDVLLDREEKTYAGNHRVFRDAHERYLLAMASTNLTGVTANQRLEAALVDGVEHSRAAREFLDSLIEMEKAFAEKLRLESESPERTPESTELLSAMKDRFYKDLHERMACFFSNSPQAYSKIGVSPTY